MEETLEITQEPIVIIYLNNKLPRYARKNIKYLSRTFPKKRIVVVSNVEDNKSRISNLKNVEFYLLENFTREVSRLTLESKLPIDFRNGFWISTIARFKALEIFMRNEGVDRALHIEADVLLLWNFPFECDLLRNSKLAFPYVSENKAAASIFYVGDISTLVDFNTFIVTSIRRDPGITDMGILAEYGNTNDENVTRLFSGFGEILNACSDHIFDAATFGMYLTGQDPRNSKGFVRTYFDVDDHAVKPSKIIFNYNEKKESVVRIGSKNYILANLHVHSKQSKYFSKNRSGKLIRMAIADEYKQQKKTFSFEIWSGMVINYLVKRIRKIFS